VYQRSGLGAVIGSDGSIAYPQYCNWLPFADFTEACQPATPAQIQAMQKAQLSQIAAVNPDLAAQGLALGDQAVQAYQNTNAADYCAYSAAVNNPTLSQMFGTNFANWIQGTDPTTCTQVTPGWIWIGIGIAGLLLLLRR